jgi:L-lactate dehydrogenase complex protein LldF
MRVLALLGRKNGHFKSFGINKGWTKDRDFPAPEGKTFQQLWSEKGGRRL